MRQLQGLAQCSIPTTTGALRGQPAEEEVTDRYQQLVDELTELVRTGFSDGRRPDYVANVQRLTLEIDRESGFHSYVGEKTSGIRSWIDIACSGRRRKPWGLVRPEQYALEDAYKLKGVSSLNTPAIAGQHIPQNDR